MKNVIIYFLLILTSCQSYTSNKSEIQIISTNEYDEITFEHKINLINNSDSVRSFKIVNDSILWQDGIGYCLNGGEARSSHDMLSDSVISLGSREKIQLYLYSGHRFESYDSVFIYLGDVRLSVLQLNNFGTTKNRNVRDL